MHCPDSLTLSTQEGEAIMARLARYAPPRADCDLLIQVMRWYFGLVWTVQEAKLSLKRLRTVLFGQGQNMAQSPAAQRVSAVAPPQDTLTGAGEVEPHVTVGRAAAETIPKPRGGNRPGTGGLGADAYAGAERIACRHEEVAVGQRCPVCGQGTLYALPPGVELRLDGNALLSALRYAVEKLRCSACGEIFPAELPAEAGAEQYSPRARAVLAGSRYYLGVPG